MSVAPTCVFFPSPSSHSINLLLELPETGILEAISSLVLRVTVFSIEDKQFSFSRMLSLLLNAQKYHKVRRRCGLVSLLSPQSD